MRYDCTSASLNCYYCNISATGLCTIQCCQVAREGRDGVNGVRNVRLWRRKEDFQAPARCNTLPCIIAIHYHVFSQYTTMYYCNTLPCIIAIHYHVFSQYTTMYYCSTQSCILAIRNHVLSQYTTMYHQSTLPCVLAVHLCTKPPSFAMRKPRPKAKALCCDYNVGRL